VTEAVGRVERVKLSRKGGGRVRVRELWKVGGMWALGGVVGRVSVRASWRESKLRDRDGDEGRVAVEEDLGGFENQRRTGTNFG